MESIEGTPIKVGSKWKDKDPRLPNRVVEVISIGMDGTVPVITYTYKNRQSASRADRFVKAFRLVQ